MAFQCFPVLPGVTHIQDAMGVCMTLLAGEKRALLVDTGYGLEDVAAFVRTLTDLPLTVMLTHAHHDHALGARWFEKVYLFPQDQESYREFTGNRRRRAVLRSAKDKGIAVEEDAFLTAPMPPALPLMEQEIDLGGLTARVILCPGHTPGSAVVYVPERQLLLTGDDWNPCTWLFFHEALRAQDYRRNMRGLLALPFERILCSHQPHLYGRAMLEAFLNGLTDEALQAAPLVPTGNGEGVRTAQAALPEGQIFVFDRDKFEGKGEA
ncbi:MAG: MBL fold metallo-hydrolase [Clostridia bacterium]|nr:MBL fold metallo-hydrolase [Clostridia bacterium]